jgi:YihY family inner membrane protein
MTDGAPGPVLLTSLRLARFARRVVSAFLRNRGILLAGGVGYNALLSTVPFLTLTLAVLSSFTDEALVLGALRSELDFLLPQHADAFLQAAQSFLGHAAATSAVSVAALLFFSSIAFRMLEEAVATIFHASGRTDRRHPWLSALLPFLIMVLLMVSVLALTLLSSVAGGPGSSAARTLGLEVPTASGTRLLLRLVSFAGLVLLFAGTYQVLPVGRISRRLALIGGLCAATLWRGVGVLLSYYFASLSMVNVLYGSLATVVVLLLYLEGAFIIVLLGAQMIAELEASAAGGVPWYEQPRPRSGPAPTELAPGGGGATDPPARPA